MIRPLRAAGKTKRVHIPSFPLNIALISHQQATPPTVTAKTKRPFRSRIRLRQIAWRPSPLGMSLCQTMDYSLERPPICGVFTGSCSAACGPGRNSLERVEDFAFKRGISKADRIRCRVFRLEAAPPDGEKRPPSLFPAPMNAKRLCRCRLKGLL